MCRYRSHDGRGENSDASREPIVIRKHTLRVSNWSVVHCPLSIVRCPWSVVSCRAVVIATDNGQLPNFVIRHSPPMPLAIETHKLTRNFNDFCAVNGIELAVERGTFYGFLGPNGAGKSTTIKMLTGLLAPSSGQMFVLGRNMLDPRESLEAKRRV